VRRGGRVRQRVDEDSDDNDDGDGEVPEPTPSTSNDEQRPRPRARPRPRNTAANQQGLQWSDNLRDLHTVEERFKGKPGLSNAAVEKLGGAEAVQNASARALFHLFFDKALGNTIVQQTNLYYRQMKEKTP